MAALLRPSPRRLAHIALGAIVVAAGLLVTYFALRNHLRQNDEMLNVVDARRIQIDGIARLWEHGGWTRGPERLTAAVLAAIAAIVPSTAGEFQVGHVALALAWSLSAVPVYALARGMRVSVPGALGAAALAVVGPWAIYGTTLLNTPLGYLTFCTLLYLMWRTSLRPSLLADVALLVVAGLAITARVGHTPFILILAPALLRGALLGRAPGEPLRRRLARLPRTLWRDHPLLVVVAALALLVVAVKGQNGVLGSYGSEISHQHLTLHHMWDVGRVFVARITEGVAILPAFVALPWLVRELVRPRSDEGAILATLAAGFALVFLYVFYNSPLEDRYMVIAVPFIAVAAARALTRREVGPVGVLVAGVVLARAVATAGVVSDDGPFAFFVAGPALFLRRVVESKLAVVLPFGDGHMVTIVLVVAVVLAVGAAWVARTRSGRERAIPLLVLLAGVIAYQAVGAGYTMHKFSVLATQPQLTFAQQTYVDRAAHGQPVGMYAENPSGGPDLPERWMTANYFNASLVVSVARTSRFGYGCCPPNGNAPISLQLDHQTGAVGFTRRPPSLLLVPNGPLPYWLAWAQVVQGYDGFRVVRLAQPPRVTALTRSGTFPDGWGKPGGPIVIRTFPRNAAGGAPACLDASITAPAPGRRPILRYHVLGGERPVTGYLSPGEGQLFHVRLGDARSRDIRISSAAGPRQDGKQVTVAVGDVFVHRC